MGIELDGPSCQTREAAGLRTERADVAALDPADFAPVDLLLGGPPCPPWSQAGSRGGEADWDHVHLLTDEVYGGGQTTTFSWTDPRSPLVVEPLRYALALRPRFIALEQVPPVLDYWRHIARILEGEGYGCWAGILECERYGVPQTRERAILMAEFDGQPHPPRPTHQRYVPGEPAVHELTFDGELLPWVSMAEALGWGMTERPCVTVASAGSAGGGPRPLDGGSGARAILRREWEAGRYEVNTGRDWKPDGDRAGAQTRPLDEPAPSVDSKGRWHVNLRSNALPNATVRAEDEPAPTITAGHDSGERVWVHDRPATTVNGVARPGHKGQPGKGDDAPPQMDGAITVTEHEAGVLQGFAADHPWQGNKSQRFQQIGNAIPPPLARAILEALLSPVREGRIAA